MIRGKNMKVIFTHKNGREQPMQRRYADILRKLKRGTYMTRDMQAGPVVGGGSGAGVEPVNSQIPFDDAANNDVAEPDAKPRTRKRKSSKKQTKPAGEQE